MNRTLASLMGASLLVIGCGDDATVTDSSGDETTTGDVGSTGETGTTPSATTDEPATTGDPETTTGEDPTGEDGLDSSSDDGPGEECGNDVIEGAEVCDGTDVGAEDCVSQGFDGGQLGCAPDCSGYDTAGCSSISCGNGILDGKDVCDGEDFGGVTCESEGFDNGTPSCSLDCTTLDLSGCGTCGNIIVEGSEVCDSIVFLGNDCLTLGFDSGEIACSEDCLSYVTDGCGTCGNDLIDGNELCDGIDNAGQDCLSLGFDSGTLGPCDPSCEEFDTSGCGVCGNGVADGDDLCDIEDLGGETCVTQGFDNGTLACNPTCDGFVTDGCGVCGNGVIDGSESCDAALLGGETCASLGLMGGELGCSPSCQFDFANCDIPGALFGSDTHYNGFSLTPPVLPCDDISATGTPTGLTDDSYQGAPLGFTFEMYGTPFTDIFIASNGTAYFGTDANLNLSNSCFPGDTPYVVDDNILAVFWDDLNPSTGASEVYYETLGPVGARRFVVQWDTAHFSGDASDLIRVQAMFHEDTGGMTVCYPDTLSAGNIGDNGAEATSGIQGSITNGFNFSCNTPDLTSGLQLIYLPI